VSRYSFIPYPVVQHRRAVTVAHRGAECPSLWFRRARASRARRILKGGFRVHRALDASDGPLEAEEEAVGIVEVELVHPVGEVKSSAAEDEE
jgi:hypothetical protein